MTFLSSEDKEKIYQVRLNVLREINRIRQLSTNYAHKKEINGLDRDLDRVWVFFCTTLEYYFKLYDQKEE